MEDPQLSASEVAAACHSSTDTPGRRADLQIDLQMPDADAGGVRRAKSDPPCGLHKIC